MRKYCIFLSVFLSILLSMYFMISPLFAQNGVSLSKGKFVKIQSMPKKVWQTTSIEITQGKEPNNLEVKLNGKIEAVAGFLCFGYVNFIRIDPSLKVPIDPIFINFKVEGSDLQLNQVVEKGEFYLSEPQEMMPTVDRT